MKWSDAKEKLEVVSLTAALFAGMIGGGLAVVEYYDAKEKTEIERSLDFAARYAEGPTLQANRTVISMWNAELPKIRAAMRGNPGQAERLQTRMVIQAVIDYELHDEVLLLAAFYTSVIQCVDRDVCDRSTADAFFRRQIELFYTSFFPYLKFLVKTWDCTLIQPIEAYLGVPEPDQQKCGTTEVES